MLRLHPVPDVDLPCPTCEVDLVATDWYVPGMRNLAALDCPECDRSFYGDLPAGHGLYYPALLDREAGEVHERSTGKWFAEFLRDGYAGRADEPVPFRVEERRPVSTPLLVNCLDMNYVHSVNKLLNVQRHLDWDDEVDVIAMIPPFVEWMVPDDVAEVWVVEQSLSEGRTWNDWLAGEVRRRLEDYDVAYLSEMFPHLHHREFDIERFTRVEPFPLTAWEERLEEPTVTFVWRNVPSGYGSVARLWCSLPDSDGLVRRARGYANMLAEKVFDASAPAIREQRKNLVETAGHLRRMFPDLDCTVAGVGEPGGLPAWIDDQRVQQPDDEEERQLCRQYAESHVVVGVHGSHMGLPSAHAAAVVEVMPGWKRRNLFGDLLLREREQRESHLLYRTVPATSAPLDVAYEIASVLVDWPMRRIRMQERFCMHDTDYETLTELKVLEERQAALVEAASVEPRVQIGSDLARRLYGHVERLLG